METITEILFSAFVETGSLKEDNTYNEMTEEFKNAKAEKITDDNLACLQYAAMRAGFYAGVNAVRSLLNGK